MSDATITPTSLNVSRITLLSVAGMLLLAVIWGLSIPITKLGLETMPPMALTALRFGVAVPFLFLFAIGRHRIHSIGSQPWFSLQNRIGHSGQRATKRFECSRLKNPNLGNGART